MLIERKRRRRKWLCIEKKEGKDYRREEAEEASPRPLPFVSLLILYVRLPPTHPPTLFFLL